MTSGTWKTIGLEIYESDDLGNLGTWIASACDITVAARMADTHNSMLAALKMMVEGNVNARKAWDDAIKAEGTKP